MHFSKIMLYGERRQLHFTRFQFESSNLVNLVRAAMWRLISKKQLLLKLIYSPFLSFWVSKSLTTDTKIRAFSAHTNETNFENGSPRANGRSQLSAGSLLEVARLTSPHSPFQRRLSSSVQLLRPFFTTKVDTRAPVRFLTKPSLWLWNVDRALKRKVRISPERRKKVSGTEVERDDYGVYD